MKGNEVEKIKGRLHLTTTTLREDWLWGSKASIHMMQHSNWLFNGSRKKTKHSALHSCNCHCVAALQQCIAANQKRPVWFLPSNLCRSKINSFSIPFVLSFTRFPLCSKNTPTLQSSHNPNKIFSRPRVESQPIGWNPLS